MLEQFPQRPSWTLRDGLRLLLVIDADPMDYPPTINAARVMARAGADVTLIGGRRRRHPPLSMPRSVQLEYANYGESVGLLKKLYWGAGRLAFRAAVERSVRRLKPDLVIAYDVGAGWAALRMARAKSSKIVWHVHDNSDPRVGSLHSVRHWQARALLRRCNDFAHVVVPEQLRVDDLRRCYRIRRPISVVANAPPLRVPSRNRLLKNRLHLDAETPLAVVVGTSGLLPEAARALRNTKAPWHLCVIGSGSQRHVDAMLEAARDAGVESRVHVEGYTNYDTVSRWLEGCDVGLGLYPANSANVNWRLMGAGSVKVMGYMAAGIPSIVCSHGAFAGLVETGAIHLLEREDPNSVTRALDRLVPDGPEWARLARAARNAHASDLNTEAQLGPLLIELGLAHSQLGEGKTARR